MSFYKNNTFMETKVRSWNRIFVTSLTSQKQSVRPPSFLLVTVIRTSKSAGNFHLQAPIFPFLLYLLYLVTFQFPFTLNLAWL